MSSISRLLHVTVGVGGLRHRSARRLMLPASESASASAAFIFGSSIGSRGSNNGNVAATKMRHLSASNGSSGDAGSTENDDDDDDDERSRRRPSATTFSASSSSSSSSPPPPWENPRSMVGSLLDGTMSRAMRTLSTTTLSPPGPGPILASDNGGGEIMPDDGDYDPTEAVRNLIDATMLRSTSVLDGGGSNVDDDDDDDDATCNDDEKQPNVRNVLDATVVRSSSVLDDGGIIGRDGSGDSSGDGSSINEDDDNDNDNQQKDSPRQRRQRRHHEDKRTYLGNPSVTPTALAHSLWRSTVLPYEDTVIDATCGNGKDCLAIARMMFPDSIVGDDDDGDGDGGNARLIGIDVQSRAIRNTRRSLLATLPSGICRDHVTLHERSHERLMDVVDVVPAGRSGRRVVGLVCYNLGYLPGAPPSGDRRHSGASSDEDVNYKECRTQTETTLNSITDASLLLRVGGLLSIMAYPGSNLEESVAVEHFVEGLAMLTTRDEGGWRGYLEGIPDYYYDHGNGNGNDGESNSERGNDGGRVRTLVTRAVERVFDEGEKKQTWRAFVHKPLGRPLSPVLATAMRIK